MVRRISAEDARRFGGFPGAAFVLCAAPGYSLSGSNAKARKLLTSAGDFVGTHGYCPDEPGIDASFIASGPDIRAFGEIPRIRMIDVAPTIAAILGVPLPHAEGIPIAGILAPRRIFSRLRGDDMKSALFR